MSLKKTLDLASQFRQFKQDAKRSTTNWSLEK